MTRGDEAAVGQADDVVSLRNVLSDRPGIELRCAEGCNVVEEPWLAIRKGPLKYIHTRNHAPLLFDVAADPGETTNLMDERADEAAKLHHLLFVGIDLDERTATAIASKQTRVFLHKVMAGSPGYRWDHQPEFDAAEQYVRGPNVPIYG